MKSRSRNFYAALPIACAFLTGPASAALVVTSHPEGATITEFYDNLTNVATGLEPQSTANNQFSLDVNDSEGQSFTLSSSITLDSIYFAYAQHQSSGSFNLRIDVGNDSSNDHTFTVSVPVPQDAPGHTASDPDWADSGGFNWLQFDLSSENITLGAGQHNFSILGVTDNGEGGYLVGPWFNQSTTEDYYTGGQLLSAPTRDMYFAVTAVPEPSSSLLAMSALAGSALLRRRR